MKVRRAFTLSPTHTLNHMFLHLCAPHSYMVFGLQVSPNIHKQLHSCGDTIFVNIFFRGPN